MEHNDIFENDPQWEQDTAPEAEIKNIQKTIRKRDRKTVIISVILAAAVLLGSIYGIIPLIETLYWHPGTSKHADNASDLTLTFHAYTELFCPGWEATHVNWHEAKGLAAYDLSITIRDINKQAFLRLDAALERGQLMYGSDFADNRANPSWFSGLVAEYAPVEESKLEETREKLAQLPGYIALEAAITFPEDLNMAQLDQFYHDYAHDPWSANDAPMRITWVGIRNYTDPEDRIVLCGMDPYTGGIGFSGMEESYPKFTCMFEYPYEESLESHFRSLLQYASDQWEKDRGISIWPTRNYYKAVLDYVEENGINSYGAVVVASPEVLLNLLDSGVISYVTILDAWIDIG